MPGSIPTGHGHCRRGTRQEDHVELIASENYVSPAVLEAQGSVLTNKYAEGYPGKRYYGGCEFVDVAEQLAIDRAKQLFGADSANVQPHSGSQANQAVYFALPSPGDTILGMSLDQGGHLTHGSPVNFSGKLFKAVHTACSPRPSSSTTTRWWRSPREHKPKMIVAGFSAYSRVLDFAALSRHRRFGRSALFMSTWRTSPGWSPPGLLSEPGAVRRHRHDHHAQDAARARAAA